MNYHQHLSRVAAHEANLKIFSGFHGNSETRTITHEVWRSGGGCVPHSKERATLVRRIVDPNFSWFGGTSRYGQAVE